MADNSHLNYTIMKKLIVLPSLLVISGLFSCAWGDNRIKGNGTIVEKEYETLDYSTIRLSGTVAVEYEQKPGAPYFILYTDENIVPYIEVISRRGSLEIKTNTPRNTTLKPTRLTVRTNSTALSEARLSGATSLQIKSGLDCNGFCAELSGTSSLSIENLRCTTADINASGASVASVSGSADNARFGLSGTSIVKAGGFSVRGLNCVLSGASNLNASATGSAEAGVSGTGRLSLNGTSQTTRLHASGAANVDAFGLASASLDCSTSGTAIINASVGTSVNATASGASRIVYKGNPPSVSVKTSGTATISQK